MEFADTFLYCWTDKKTNKLYVGKHKGEENDGYVCSSKSMLQEYQKRPEDFSRTIIAHGTNKDITKLEQKILESCNAAKNDIFYNKNNGNGKFVCSGHSKETKIKISNKHQGKKFTKEHKNKIAKSKLGNSNWKGEKNYHFNKKGSLSPFFGKPKSLEHKMKIKNALMGVKHTEERKLKMKLNCPKNSLGKKWYNNGVEEKYFISGLQPKFWTKGRLR